MICPFCGKEMQNGILKGDGRSRVKWYSEDTKPGVIDRMLGTGCVTAVKYSLAVFEIEACYCYDCKKMIFETDIQD